MAIVDMTICAKLYPNLKQRVWLTRQFGNCRFIFNHGIDYCKPKVRKYCRLAKKNGKRYARKQRVYPTEKELDHDLTLMKKANPWLKISDSRSLQCSLKALLKAYQNHFSLGNGYPRYKSRKNHRQSYTTTSIPKQVSNNKLRLAKLGPVKAHFAMPITEKVKQMTVIHEPDGSYQARLVVKCEKQALPKTGKWIGIDVGLLHLLNLSNGMKFDFKHYSKFVKNQKYDWEKREARRRIHAKRVIKYFEWAHYFDNNIPLLDLDDFRNYQKARIMVAKYSRKIKNQRYNYLQWLTTWLVRRYDMIAIENLKVSKMLKNHHLAHSISGGAWRTFRILLQYKCDWYGKTLVPVNKDYTTQTCCQCGYNMSKHGHKIQLGIEHWICPECHQYHDRDTNASRVILKRALSCAV